MRAAILALILSGPLLYAQPPDVPVLAAPQAGVTLTADNATVVYIGDKAHLAEDDAVRRTHARLTLKGKDAALEINVTRFEVRGDDVEELIGKTHLVSESTGDLEYRIEVPSSGRWRIEIIDYETRRRSILYQAITVGPKPDVDPVPDPVPPAPPDTEAPFAADGFAVLIIHEASTTAKLPPAQKSILTSSKVHQFINARAVKLSDGSGFYRIYDDDYDASTLANVPAPLKKAYLDTKGLWEANTPWIGINDGKGGGFAGPLPKDVDATLDLLKRHTK